MKAPGYVDAGRALIEEHGGHRFAYGAWDRVFGCWVARNGESAREVVPFWPVLDSQGGLARDVANRRACRVQMEAVEPCDTLALNWHGLWPEWLRAPRLSPVAAAALERFISRIPEAHRRRAAPYGAWQWAVLDGIWRVPGFADFLDAEAEGFGPNYVIACLALANVWQREAKERCILVERLMNDRRHLMLAALSQPVWSRAAVRGLRKFDPAGMTRFLFLEYARFMQDRRLGRLLGHTGHLNRHLILVLHRLPEWMAQPECMDALGEPGAIDAVDRLDVLAQTVSGHAKLHLVQQLRQSLKQRLTGGSLVAWAADWERRIMSRLCFPRPPIPGTALLRPLTSARALREEGVHMQNCLAGKIGDVLDGTAYYYRWCGRERASVELLSADNGAWVVGEHVGVRNAQPSAHTTAEIQLVVARQVAAGLKAREDAKETPPPVAPAPGLRQAKPA